MRITGGYMGGLKLRVPAKGVRPATDRVREAVFSALGESVAGARVLDLFAGCGAYGLEAWSRGAIQVCWVEKDPSALKALRDNLGKTGRRDRDALRVVAADVYSFLARGSSMYFNLAFMDPPYDKSDGDVHVRRTLEALLSADLLLPGALLVCEMSARQQAGIPEGWETLRDKAYGTSRVVLMRKHKELA